MPNYPAGRPLRGQNMYLHIVSNIDDVFVGSLRESGDRSVYAADALRMSNRFVGGWAIPRGLGGGDPNLRALVRELHYWGSSYQNEVKEYIRNTMTGTVMAVRRKITSQSSAWQYPEHTPAYKKWKKQGGKIVTNRWGRKLEKIPRSSTGISESGRGNLAANAEKHLMATGGYLDSLNHKIGEKSRGAKGGDFYFEPEGEGYAQLAYSLEGGDQVTGNTSAGAKVAMPKPAASPPEDIYPWAPYVWARPHWRYAWAACLSEHKKAFVSFVKSLHTRGVNQGNRRFSNGVTEKQKIISRGSSSK